MVQNLPVFFEANFFSINAEVRTARVFLQNLDSFELDQLDDVKINKKKSEIESFDELIKAKVFSGADEIEISTSSGILIRLKLIFKNWKGVILNTYQFSDVSKNEIFLKSLISYTKCLFDLGVLKKARITRGGTSDSLFPDLPEFGASTYVMIISPQGLKNNFSNLEEHLANYWDEVEQKGDYYWLARAKNKIGNIDFLKAIYQKQWAMARYAIPEETSYSLPNPNENELAFLQQEPARLSGVGYYEDEKKQIYSCYLEPDQHIAGWEILSILKILKTGEDQEKRAVEEVHIIFAEQAMAKREKRPLLDVGAKVFFLADDGQTKEIQE